MPAAAVTTIVLGLIAALTVAACVAVIAVKPLQTSVALARDDATLAALPHALAAWSRRSNCERVPRPARR